MKKKQFCKETKRVVYIDREGVAHCMLVCVVELGFDYEDIPWSLTSKLGSKYPMVKHEFGDTYSIHIETKATCHGGDVFDEKKGKTIAYSKAQLKLYRILEKMFKDMQDYFEKQKERSTAVLQMFTRYKNREENFISSI